MSLSSALNSAVSGLNAVSRGMEVVSANLSNINTPGYGRRVLDLAAQTLGGNQGGVRVVGVSRLVTGAILAEHREASADQAARDARAAFASAMQQAVGIPGEAGSLGSLLQGFRESLNVAATRPDDGLRLDRAVEDAGRVVRRLNVLQTAVQQQRTDADRNIDAMVDQLNAGVARVAHLNRQIVAYDFGGADISSLIDERQRVIDQISQFVPLQEIQRDHNQVALFTREGAVLLDGVQPVTIGFEAAGEFVPSMTVGVGNVRRLVYGDTELTSGQMRMFSGGRLEAAFAIRDGAAPTLQAELDNVALELHDRFASATVDPTLTAGAPGLFTDAGALADPALRVGLAGRLRLNTAVDPSAGGETRRLRDGIGATMPGPVGRSHTLIALGGALTAAAPAPSGGPFTSAQTMIARVGEVEARVATRRVDADRDAAVSAARAQTFKSRLLDEGVDSDAEMQRLLLHEQAYAANARVIQAIDEMLNVLLRV